MLTPEFWSATCLRTCTALAIVATATITPANANDVTSITKQGGCPDCDLRLMELRELDIDGADFRETVLREADMKGVNLPNGSFQYVDFGEPSWKNQIWLAATSLAPPCERWTWKSPT